MQKGNRVKWLRLAKSEKLVSLLVAPDEHPAVDAWQNDPPAVVARVSFCAVMDMGAKAKC